MEPYEGVRIPPEAYLTEPPQMYTTPMFETISPTAFAVGSSATVSFSSSSSSCVPPPTDQPQCTFNVGDRVILRPTSQYRHQAPDGLPGTIDEIRAGMGLPYQIQWDDKTQNAYGEEDLILLQSVSQNLPIPIKGMRVVAIVASMSHYLCPGIIDRVEDTKIWVRWPDGELTHTSNNHLREITCICPDPLPLECTTCHIPCLTEIERRGRVSKAEQERLAREQEIYEKRKKYAKQYCVYVSSTLFNFLSRELKEHQNINRAYPFMYLLGVNKKGIITKIQILRGDAGCKDMQAITPYEIMKAQKEIFKAKLTVAGIGRVGRFSTGNREGIVSIASMAPECILLSLNEDSMWGYRWVDDGNFKEPVKVEVHIVNPRKKIGKEVK